MTENGSVDAIKISVEQGKVSIVFNKDYNMRDVCYFLHLAILQLDNAIMASQEPEKPKVVIPQNVIDRMRDGRKL